MPDPRLAVVVSFDRMPCAGLGCYGNEWIDTPSFDTISASGFVFDNHIVNSTQLGSSAWCDPLPFLGDLTEAGVGLTLLSERHSWDVFGHLGASRATAVPRQISGRSGFDRSAKDHPFARLVRATLQRLRRAPLSDGPALLWLHGAGLPAQCRPPNAALDLYAEEFSERGTDWESLTSDEFQRHPAIRGAYLSLMDVWLGRLVRALDQMGWPYLLQVIGFKGRLWQPVPRRRDLPPDLDPQVVQAPWIIATRPGLLPDETQHREEPGITPGRSSVLVQTSDFLPTLKAWLLANPQERPSEQWEGVWPVIAGAPVVLHEEAMTRGLNGRTSHWTREEQRISLHAGIGEAWRYLKPEDPWSVNDVPIL